MSPAIIVCEAFNASRGSLVWVGDFRPLTKSCTCSRVPQTNRYLVWSKSRIMGSNIYLSGFVHSASGGRHIQGSRSGYWSLSMGRMKYG